VLEGQRVTPRELFASLIVKYNRVLLLQLETTLVLLFGIGRGGLLFSALTHSLLSRLLRGATLVVVSILLKILSYYLSFDPSNAMVSVTTLTESLIFATVLLLVSLILRMIKLVSSQLTKMR